VSCHVPNGVRLRRNFFFPQGTPEGAGSRYVTQDAMLRKAKKEKQDASVDA